jgi:hypothetical protein
MDPLRLAVALGPLAIYLLLLGALNLSRRPLLTTGARDIAALGVALSGLILVGPLELFMPRDLAFRFGSLGWLYWTLLASFYLSCLTLLVLSARPRLSLYNIAADDARQLLARVASQLDPAAHWAGDTLTLPELRVQLVLDPFPLLRSVALTPVGSRQSYHGWKRLERALRPALRSSETTPNPAGLSFCLFGATMLAAIATRWVADPQAVADAFQQIMGL